jgi:phytanoyl-CoA hydroxylase
LPEDIHPDAGPLQYFPGSHNVKVTGFFDWGDGSILLEPDSVQSPTEFSVYLANKMAEQGIEPVTFCPKKGDVFIWHGGLVHGGTEINNTEITRKSYVTHYSSLEAFPKAHMEVDALDTGAFLKLNNGYSFEWPWMKDIKKIIR